MAESKTGTEAVGAVNSQAQMIKMFKIMLIMFVLILFAFGGMSFYFLKSMQDKTQTSSASSKGKSKVEVSHKEEAHKENEHKEEGSAEASNKEEGHKEEGAKSEETAGGDTGKPLYYKFAPSIVTSIAAKDQMRYLRVDVELVSKDKVMIENLSTYSPIIRNELTNLFSSQNYDELILPQTKDILRKKVNDSVKKIMKDHTGNDNIDQVLFTTFIIQ